MYGYWHDVASGVDDLIGYEIHLGDGFAFIQQCGWHVIMICI
jgi:hypothetical protein